MFKIFLVISVFLLTSMAACAQNRSVYTSLTGSDCSIRIDSTMPGVGRGICRGVGDYKLKILSDDERMSVNVIAPNAKQFELDFWGYFGNFSSVGERAEWRMKGKRPIAVIIRYDVADRGVDDDKRTSYLIVSKITDTGACVVAIVKPGQNQNAQARRLADSAAGKPCKQTE